MTNNTRGIEMLKIFFITSLFILAFSGCRKDTLVEPFDYERDTPVWLKEKIDSMSVDNFFAGTKIFRYEWKRNFMYHIMIPLSSSVYCELYDQSGNRPQLDQVEFQDFLKNKKNEIIIWERKF